MFTDEADYLIHDIKVHEKMASEEEIKHWSDLLKSRSEERMNFIKQHLGISSKIISDMILNDTKSISLSFKALGCLKQRPWYT